MEYQQEACKVELDLCCDKRIRLARSCFENLHDIGMYFADNYHMMDKLELGNGQIHPNDDFLQYIWTLLRMHSPSMLLELMKWSLEVESYLLF